MVPIIAALFAGILAGQAVTPAPAAANCPVGAAASDALPAELKGWSALQGVTAGSSMAMPATLAIGRSARATLIPTGDVSYPLAPERAAEAGSSGGIFAFDVTSAGLYRVALGTAAWVDVLAGGKTVTSVAHGHGPDCSGVRKYVDFRVQPGRYLVQVSGNKTPTLTLMVARVEG